MSCVLFQHFTSGLVRIQFLFMIGDYAVYIIVVFKIFYHQAYPFYKLHCKMFWLQHHSSLADHSVIKFWTA